MMNRFKIHNFILKLQNSLQSKMIKNLLRDYGTAICIAVILALLIRIFVVEAYRIPTYAMKPALEAGDTILVLKLFKKGKLPYYGDVIIFSPPAEPHIDYIKRVVALPGDVIEIRQGKLILNSTGRVNPNMPDNALCGIEQLPHKSYQVCWDPPLLNDLPPTQIPPNSLFVLGDLRTQPQDIRKQKGWGMIPVSSIKAKALWIWLSIEPPTLRGESSWFSRIRFERMFKAIQ